MSKYTADEKFIKVVNRYAVARLDYADLGSIPICGQDREEQNLIDRTRARIIREHSAAWTALMKFAPSKILGAR